MRMRWLAQTCSVGLMALSSFTKPRRTAGGTCIPLAALRAAFRLPAREGLARLEKQAEWLEREYPSAAASLREGLTEMFTVNRLGLSPSLSRCLVSTNVIESPPRGVRLRTRKICRWRDGKMVLRWAAAALLMTEQNFRRIMGCRDLWMLKAALDQNKILVQQKVA